jgi:hypothetical protein
LVFGVLTVIFFFTVYKLISLTFYYLCGPIFLEGSFCL